MGTHDWMLGIRVLRLHRQALFFWHGGSERRVEAVIGDQALDFLLHIHRQFVISNHHVGPHGVATSRRAFDATQNRTHRRRFTPRGITMPGVLVAIWRIFRRLVDLQETGRLRVAREHWMSFELSQTLGKCFMVAT
ncbi:hypothetical protein D3C81_1858640 [compost metagenome]